MLTKHLFGLALLCLAFAGASTLSGQYVATQITNDYNVLDISGTGTDQTGNFVASGSALGVDDEGVVNNVAMGFTFDFYGNSYTTINISVNGYLTFSPITASTYTRPTSTPNAAVPNNYIAGAWFDGGGSGAWGATAKVYTQTFGTSPNSEFRVQFVNWERYNNTGSNSFLYRVFEDGSIEVHYGTCDAFAATGASTAVENSTGTIGTASVGGFTRNTTPTQADRFAPPQNPTAAPATGSAFTGSTTAGFDATVDTGVALSNFSISCNDPNNATIDATITTSGAAPGVTQPADVTAGTVAFTLTWTGTGSSAGTYTYNVTLDDGTLQTSFDVRITITSPAPLLSAPYAPPPSSAIQITEIALDPGTSGDEYCEIQNVSSTAVTLTNWTITVWDGSTTPDFTNTINTVTLQPGDTYIFCDNGSATFPAANQGFSANLLWDGTNCGAMVQDDSGNIVDCVFWGNMNVPTITQPLAIGSEWVGASLTTISINSGYERGGTADNDDASDWTVQTTDSIGGTNSGLTLPFTTSGTTTIGGTDPNFTGTAIVGDSLEVTFTATDTSTTQTLTYTITRTGGTLTAAAAGFNQTFTAGVYNDPAPGTTPHSLTLDGTAATVGTITFDVLVSDGALTDTYSYALTIDPPPPAEINLQNGSAANVLTGTTDTIATSIPAGFQQTYTYTIQNLAAGTLNLTGTPLVANTGTPANCGVSITQPSSNQVAGNGSITFSVGITASSAGSWSADFEILNNDADEGTYTFTIAGTAYDPTPEIDLQRPAGVANSIANNGTDTITGTFNTVPTTLTYTIDNQDLGDLILSGTPLVAVGAQNNCNASLAAGGPTTPITANGSTTFTIDLTPTAATPTAWSFTLTIPNNDANEAPYFITVTGVAAPTPAPEIDLQRPAGAGNSIAVGGTDTVTGTAATVTTTITYTVANTGNATLNLNGTPRVAIVGTPSNCNAVYGNNAPATVGLTSSATFTIDITPTNSGTWTVNVSMPNDDANEDPYTWTITGSAAVAPAPEIDLQRPAGAGNSIAVGGADTVSGTVAATPTTITYTIANTGNAALTVSTPTFTGTPNNCVPSVGSPPPASIAAASTATFTINVTPNASGNWSFSVSMVNNDSNENPYTWTVSGTAQATPAPDIDIQVAGGASIANGGTDSRVNFTGTQTVTYTVANTGAVVLTMTGANSVTITNQVNCTALVAMQPAGTVAPSGTTTFDVQVIAPTSGTFSFTISIASDDPDEDPYVVNFSGNTGAGTVLAGGGGGGGGGGCATATTGGYAWVLLALLVIPAIITRRRKA